MGIHSTSGDRKGKQFTESKKGRRKQRKASPVQILYETCKEVFANCGPGIVPSAADVERLKSVLDRMTVSDVGLKLNMPFFKKNVVNGLPNITYLRLYECEKFSIWIFCLPPSGVIPLHNHPEMTVFNRLLFGTMHIKSYDWVDNVLLKTVVDNNTCNTNGTQSTGGETMHMSSGVHSTTLRLAKLKVDSNFTAPCTSVLYPADGGNMHCFTALTACAVLDVLGPPYSKTGGRDCSYFLEFPFSKFSVDAVAIPEEERKNYAWLQEREEELPKDLVLVAERYEGPKIVLK